MKNSLVILLLICGFSSYAQDINIEGTIAHPLTEYLLFKKISKNIFDQQADTPVTVLVDKSGYFKVNLKSEVAALWSITDGNSSALIDLQPGNNLKINFSKLYYYDGYEAKGDRLNDLNFMSALDQDSVCKTQYGDDFFKKLRQIKDLKEGLRLREQKAIAELDFIERYQKKYPMTETFYNWKKSEFKYEPYIKLIYENFTSDFFVQNQDLFDHLTKAELNNNVAALNSDNYNSFIELYAMFKIYHGKLTNSRLSEVFLYGNKTFEGLTREVLLTGIMTKIAPIDSIYNRLYGTFIQLLKIKSYYQL